MLTIVDRPLDPVCRGRGARGRHRALFRVRHRRNKGMIEIISTASSKLDVTFRERGKKAEEEISPATSRLLGAMSFTRQQRRTLASATRCGARARPSSATSRSRCCCRPNWCSIRRAASSSDRRGGTLEQQGHIVAVEEVPWKRGISTVWSASARGAATCLPSTAWSRSRRATRRRQICRYTALHSAAGNLPDS